MGDVVPGRIGMERRGLLGGVRSLSAGAPLTWAVEADAVGSAARRR